jgi:hypothetical protein
MAHTRPLAGPFEIREVQAGDHLQRRPAGPSAYGDDRTRHGRPVEWPAGLEDPKEQGNPLDKKQNSGRISVALIEGRDRLRTLAELPFQRDGEDSELLLSRDWNDSNGQYEREYPQVACRFANRWKINDRDDNFRRFVCVLKGDKTDA